MVQLAPDDRPINRLVEEDGVLFARRQPGLRAAVQLGAHGAEDLLATLLLREGEVHPLDELLREDPRAGRNDLHAEEPKIGLELLGLETPRVGRVTEPLVVLVLSGGRRVGNDDVDDDEVTAGLADSGHFRDHGLWIRKVVERVTR